jgi:hypothetical protein
MNFTVGICKHLFPLLFLERREGKVGRKRERERGG